MESLVVFPDGEWGSFSEIFSSDELEMPRFLSHFCSPENYDAGVGSPAPVCVDSPANIGGIGANKSWFFALDATDFNLSKQGHSYSCISSPTPQPNDNSLFIDMDFVGEEKAGSFLPFLTDVLEEDHGRALLFHGDMGGDGFENLYYNHPASTAIDSSNEEQGFKRKFNGGLVNTISSDNPKKKTRVTQHVKSRKTVDSSKPTSKIKKNCSKTSVEDDGNGGYEGQSSSTCSTADDNASLETNGGSSSDSKTRAERGSATDPQSLYARKRRERINERLRILQKLVPNGTKVDISTMLEEAVHYVKFLQHQIKLLSSDDHWMYAPIAYNGMDIGLHQKISPILFH